MPLPSLAVRIAIQLTPVDEEESDTVVGVVLRTCSCHTVVEGRVLCIFRVSHTCEMFLCA